MSWDEQGSACDRSIDAAPYVLRALEDPQRYRDHLVGCAVCTAEVAALRPVVDTLPTGSEHVVASQALRQRILATVRSEAEVLRAAGPAGDEPPRMKTPWQAMRRPLSIGFALAAVAAALAIALTNGASRPERVSYGSAATAVSGAHASLRQVGTRAELKVSGMPQAPLGRIYEVWLRRASGSPQPTDALFSVTSRGDGSVGVPDRLNGVSEVMVTSEPLGGSQRPTSPPLIRVMLPA